MDEFEKSQQDLQKALGEPESEGDQDALEQLNRDGINSIRKNVGAPAIQKGGKPPWLDKKDDDDDDEGDDDDDDDDEDEDDKEKSLDYSTEYADGDDVFTGVVKSASGELVQLIEGDVVFAELVKAFSDEIGGTNLEVAKTKTILKAVYDNAALQNRAILSLGQKLDEVLGALGKQPVKKADPGVKRGATEMLHLQEDGDRIQKALLDAGKGVGGSTAADSRYGGATVDGLAMAVEKAFGDPEIRDKFGLTPDHLGGVRRRGITHLPGAFVEYLREQGVIQ